MDREQILAALTKLIGRETRDGWRMGELCIEHGIQSTLGRRRTYEAEYFMLRDKLRQLDGRPKLRKKYRRG